MRGVCFEMLCDALHMWFALAWCVRLVCCGFCVCRWFVRVGVGVCALSTCGVSSCWLYVLLVLHAGLVVFAWGLLLLV